MKTLFTSAMLFLALVLATGCKKDSDTLLNATAYLEEDRVISNIAFVPGSVTFNSSDEARAYFEGNPHRSQQSTSQYSEYVPDGTYTILIYIAIGYMEGAYTYRTVHVSAGNPSTDNIMVFTQSASQRGYQPWKNKY